MSMATTRAERTEHRKMHFSADQLDFVGQVSGAIPIGTWVRDAILHVVRDTVKIPVDVALPGGTQGPSFGVLLTEEENAEIEAARGTIPFATWARDAALRYAYVRGARLSGDGPSLPSAADLRRGGAGA